MRPYLMLIVMSLSATDLALACEKKEPCPELPSFKSDPTPSPPLRLAVDGYPAGQGSAEGVAADYMRAFIQENDVLFRSSTLRLRDEDYAEDRERMSGDLRAAWMEPGRRSRWPKAITKLYSARFPSKNGPRSFAYATYDMHEVMFVDVVVETNSGDYYEQRLLTMLDKNGRWYVNFRPSAFLSVDDESMSIVEYPRQVVAIPEAGDDKATATIKE